MNLFHLSTRLREVVRFVQGNMKTFVFAGCFSMVTFGLGLSAVSSLGLTFLVYLSTGGWRFARQVILTGPRDVRAFFIIISLRLKMQSYIARRIGVPTLFSETCNKHSSKTCFVDVAENKRWTFQDVDEHSNMIANYFLSEGYTKGDSVALFMESSAEYVCIWLGLAKIGIIPALINFNLRQDSLRHCLDTAGSKAMIYSAELEQAVNEAKPSLSPSMRLIRSGSDSPMTLNCLTSRPPNLDYDFNGPLLFIYTSGTTGLPKAAKVSHSRYFYMSCSLAQLFGLGDDEVVYDTLPLYHTAGGVLGIGQALIRGSTVVIRKKFSASNFWSDCIKYDCTAAQYIGEICRYLLAQPAKTEDRTHKVRTIFGNGLRPQIWEEFRNRFNIERVGEFYGSTEGNANAANTDNKVGCVGFGSVIFPSFHPIAVILVDERTELPLRGPGGFCIRAPPGQPGELVGRIDSKDPMKRFDGYSSKAATEKKIAVDVFAHGDSYFRTGDMLVMDDLGYLMFKDRTGDTFRWKGENVSTSEVEATVSNKVDKRDAVAYGVEIPGCEGRACMVAIENMDGLVDVSALYKALCPVLPAYARPIFIRLLSVVDKTGTFKLKKVDLRNEGYDLSKVHDQMYYLNSKAARYEPLSTQVYADIKNGKIRF